MATWNSRGLRGSVLEDYINMTIEKYNDCGIALIQKIPTPIKPIKIDPEKRHITLAYFQEKSTVDYIGVVQGVPLCFDAKECSKDTFSMQNIHEHQYKFMSDFESQKGISFLIIYFTNRDEAFYLPFEKIAGFYERSINGVRKSFRYTELDPKYRIPLNKGVPLHFLENINIDLLERNEKNRN